MANKSNYTAAIKTIQVLCNPLVTIKRTEKKLDSEEVLKYRREQGIEITILVNDQVLVEKQDLTSAIDCKYYFKSKWQNVKSLINSIEPHRYLDFQKEVEIKKNQILKLGRNPSVDLPDEFLPDRIVTNTSFNYEALCPPLSTTWYAKYKMEYYFCELSLFLTKVLAYEPKLKPTKIEDNWPNHEEHKEYNIALLKKYLGKYFSKEDLLHFYNILNDNTTARVVNFTGNAVEFKCVVKWLKESPSKTKHIDKYLGDKIIIKKDNYEKLWKDCNSNKINTENQRLYNNVLKEKLI